MLRRGALRNTKTFLCLAALVLALSPGAVAARAAALSDDDDDSASPAPVAPAAKAYAIKLSRPMKVGQKFSWVADATAVNSVSGMVSGQARSAVPESVSVHLNGVVRVLAVNRDGEPTVLQCTVQECYARTGRERKTVVAPGKVITAEAGKWKTKLSPESGTLTIEEDILLRTVLSLPRLDDVSDDEAYGTGKRVKAGESWAVKADEVLRSWAAAGYKLKKNNVSGNVRLKSVENVEGVECIRVTGRAKIEHFLPPALDLPEGVKIDDATVEYKFTKLATADPAGPVLLDSHSMTVTTVIKNDATAISPDARIEGKFLRSVGVKLKPLAE